MEPRGQKDPSRTLQKNIPKTDTKRTPPRTSQDLKKKTVSAREREARSKEEHCRNMFEYLGNI